MRDIERQLRAAEAPEEEEIAAPQVKSELETPATHGELPAGAAPVPQWVTSWPEWFGLGPITSVTVVPLVDYVALEHRLRAAVAERDAALSRQPSEYICKCGLRVVPHRCSTAEDF